jgi:hypothetical protein
MTYPTLQEVEAADRYQICKWHRFLPSAITDEQLIVQARLWERFKEVDGFTPEISKAIGWNP